MIRLNLLPLAWTHALALDWATEQPHRLNLGRTQCSSACAHHNEGATHA